MLTLYSKLHTFSKLPHAVEIGIEFFDEDLKLRLEKHWPPEQAQDTLWIQNFSPGFQ